MQLLLLLAAFFVVVKAAVTPSRHTGMVTLPLKRREPPTRGLHPQVLLQQHINRASRRLARMTGRAEPSLAELRSDLNKRLVSVEASTSQFTKRFDRENMPGRVNSAVGNAVSSTGLKASTKGHTTGAGAMKATTHDNSAGFSSIDFNAPDVTKANAPKLSNSLGLDIEAADVGYLATIQIGTPPQDFEILVDSGSADFWVGSANCHSQYLGRCGNHTFLGSDTSESFRDTNIQFAVTYGTGNVMGNIVTDTIIIAGLPLPAHRFGVAKIESMDFSDDSVPFSGLMGFASSVLSEQHTPTPVESLTTAGLIKEAITSFKISRLADKEYDGQITLGGLDETKFDAATLTTMDNISKEGFWEADMSKVTVNGQDSGLTGRTAILDTGTTLIVAPYPDAMLVHGLIPGAKPDGQGGYTIPCTTNASVALTFGDTSFGIDPRDIIIAPVDVDDLRGDCVSGISSGSVGGATEWLVGDVFLKNAYFSIDLTNNTISLAKLV